MIYIKDELDSYLSENRDNVELKDNALATILSNLPNTITIKDFYKLNHDGYSNGAITNIKFKDGSSLNIDEINYLAINNEELLNLLNKKTVINSPNSYSIDESKSKMGVEITTSSGDDKIQGSNFNDTIKSLDGNDIIKALDGDDYIDGGNGNDILVGGGGDDTLIGGNGNDTYLYEEINFKKDTIDNYDTSKFRNDTIEFGQNITKDDLFLFQDNDDLMIYIKDKNFNFSNRSYDDLKSLKSDSIRVKNFYFMKGDNAYSAIDFIKFKDGSVLDKEDISRLALSNIFDNSKKLSVITNHNYTIDNSNTNSFNLKVNTLKGDDSITLKGLHNVVYSNSGNDTITILDGKAKIYSGSGNDTITLNGDDNYVNSGDEDDKIYSGNGNDTIIGGSGNDIYIFNKNFGKDVIINEKSISTEKDIIKFSDDTNKNDLIFKQDGYDLIICLKDNLSSTALKDILDSNNYMRIKNFYTLNNGLAKNIIDVIEFKNGEKLNIKDINDLALLNADSDSKYLNVTTNDDYKIEAKDTNSIITTLGGDDVINVGNGDNTIYSNSGDDIISTGSGNNTIYSGDGDDIIKTSSGNDTLIGGSGNDIYEFKKEFGKDIIISSNNLAIDKDIIKFSDDTTSDDLKFYKKR